MSSSSQGFRLLCEPCGSEDCEPCTECGEHFIPHLNIHERTDPWTGVTARFAACPHCGATRRETEE